MFTKNYYRLLYKQMHALSGSSTMPNIAGTTVSSSSLHQWLYASFYSSYQSFIQGAKSIASGTGVIFGDGDTAPTIDDTQLAGSHLESYSGSVSYTLDEDQMLLTVLYTITNSGSSDFTVKEIGIALNSVLIVREVLESPIIIPASGVGQVTLTIKLNL